MLRDIITFLVMVSVLCLVIMHQQWVDRLSIRLSSVSINVDTLMDDFVVINPTVGTGSIKWDSTTWVGMKWVGLFYRVPALKDASAEFYGEKMLSQYSVLAVVSMVLMVYLIITYASGSKIIKTITPYLWCIHVAVLVVATFCAFFDLAFSLAFLLLTPTNPSVYFYLASSFLCLVFSGLAVVSHIEILYDYCYPDEALKFSWQVPQTSDSKVHFG